MKSALSAAILISAVIMLPLDAKGALVYGVSDVGATQSLVTWDSAAPGALLSSAPITGLPTNETIRAIDFDPVYFPGHHRLFAIGASSDGFANVYLLDQITGVAAQLPPDVTPPISPPAAAVGQYYGMIVAHAAIMPVIQSVDESGRMIRYSSSTNSGALETTVVQPDGSGTPRPVVHLYELFAIDPISDALVEITAGAGQFAPADTIGPLGADFDNPGGMDAATQGSRDEVFAAALPAGQSQSNFYTINLQTGAATLIGPIGTGHLISAMAVEPVIIPEPTPALLAPAALLACLCARRKRADLCRLH